MLPNISTGSMTNNTTHVFNLLAVEEEPEYLGSESKEKIRHISETVLMEKGFGAAN